MRPAIALFLLSAATGGWAQEMAFSPAGTEACLAGAEGASECIAVSARICMEDNTGGETTVGMSACLDQGYRYWDARLNGAYSGLMAEARVYDADMAKIGSSAPRQAPALREMQVRWSAYRDARCAYVRSQWGTGTGAGPAMLDCLMQTTGEQALFLEQMRDGF